MGWFIDSLKSLGGDLLGKGVDLGFKYLENETMGLSKAQEEQNAWQSQENLAAFERESQFNAKMAEEERAWQEEQNERYNSIAGKVQQAHEAGVNPLYAVTGSAVSPAQSHGVAPSASSSPMSSSAGPRPSGSMSNLVQEFLGMSKLKSEMERMKAESRSLNARALRDEILSQFDAGVSEASIASAMASVRSSDADAAFKTASIGEIGKRISLMDADIKVKGQMFHKLVAETINVQADTDVKTARLAEIGANIANMEADAWLKVQTAGLVAKQQITEMYKWDEISAHCDWLREDIERVSQVTSESDAREALIKLQQDTEKWVAKGYKRNYKWQPAVNSVSMVSQLVSAAGQLISGVKGIPSVPFTSHTTHKEEFEPFVGGKIGF